MQWMLMSMQLDSISLAEALESKGELLCVNHCPVGALVHASRIAVHPYTNCRSYDQMYSCSVPITPKP